jgi:hypothetical protein
MLNCITNSVKNCRSVIICEIIVHLVVVVQNKKMYANYYKHMAQAILSHDRLTQYTIINTKSNLNHVLHQPPDNFAALRNK